VPPGVQNILVSRFAFLLVDAIRRKIPVVIHAILLARFDLRWDT
jgi:hypothetical protein